MIEEKNNSYGSYARTTIEKYQKELEEINEKIENLMKVIVKAQENYTKHLEKGALK